MFSFSQFVLHIMCSWPTLDVLFGVVLHVVADHLLKPIAAASAHYSAVYTHVLLWE